MQYFLEFIQDQKLIIGTCLTGHLRHSDYCWLKLLSLLSEWSSEYNKTFFSALQTSTDYGACCHIIPYLVGLITFVCLNHCFAHLSRDLAYFWDTKMTALIKWSLHFT